ncbi:MAG: hypothetical protein ACREKR_01400 [Candidatus Methylomirabilales bacterium]
MGDGHFALNGELEVWDEGDQPNALVGDGRSLAQAADPEHTFDVLYDLPSAVDIGIPFLRELAALAGSDAAPRYQAKKAVEPLSALVIAVGVFTVGAIARGFLRKLGEDLYEKLKEKLKAAAKPRPGRERLLAIQVAVVAADGRRVLVEVVLTDPTEADVETLLTSGLKKLDAVVARTIAENPTAVEVVAELIHGDVRVLYWIRSDGVPSVIKSVPHQELIAQGLSIGAIIDDTEPRE